jgi:hypothetical protein
MGTKRRIGVMAAGLAAMTLSAGIAVGLSGQPSGATSHNWIDLGGTPTDQPVGVRGETFYTATASRVIYTSGSMLLSGTNTGTGQVGADDEVILTVTHADHTVATWTHDFSNHCSGVIRPIPAVNVTSKFKAGVNKVQITEKDICGGNEGSRPLYLVF